MMSLARQYFSIIVIMNANIFSITCIHAMETPLQQECIKEKQKAAREKKAHLQALKIQRAVKKDPILRAAEKELKICSGKSLVGYPATIIIQNNFASPVIVGQERKTIKPLGQKTIVIDFNKISNRLGHFEVPIYDTENALIAQLDGFRHRMMEEKSHSFGTAFSTFYTDGAEPTNCPDIDAEKDYYVYLQLSGTRTIAGKMKLTTNNTTFFNEEKNNQQTPHKIPVSASSCALNKNYDYHPTNTPMQEADPFQKNKPQRPMRGIPVSQSATNLESKKPAFPTPKKQIDEYNPDKKEKNGGSLITSTYATLRTLGTGSLIITSDAKKKSFEAPN